MLRLALAAWAVLGPMPCGNDVFGKDSATGLAAVAIRPVHPVLIRNEHGPLLRIVVEVENRNDVGVTGLSLPQLDLHDRHVGIVYEGSQAHLVFEKLSLAELLGR